MKKILVILFAILLATILYSTAFAVDFNEDIELTDAEISSMAGIYSGRVLKAARFKDGMIATLDGNEVAYYVNGEQVMLWRHETSPDDAFYSTKIAYPDAEFDLFAVLGTDICSFSDDIEIRQEATGVVCQGLIDNYADYLWEHEGAVCYQFFTINDGAFHIWTPYAYVMVSNSGVQYVATEGEYVFFYDDYGLHAINACLSEINRRSQRYFRYHPLQIVELKDTDLWEIYGGMYWFNEEGVLRDGSELFNEQYGADITKWGHPKTDFTVEDFSYYVHCSAASIEGTFDSPAEDYSTPIVYDNIDFYGHNGRLVILLATITDVRRITWESYESSEEITAELESIVAAQGVPSASADRPDVEHVESVYEVGDQLIHVCTRYENGEEQSYVYANNRDKVFE